MNFKQTSHKTTVSIVEAAAPQAIISADAAAKMFLYVDECKDEVGWLGTAIKTDKTIFISDVYLLDQKVHATTTEIDPEGLLSFAEEILSQPDGVDTWNNLKVYGHSHVNMGCTPSGQDDKQLEEFVKGGHEWFIRLIANKKGDIRIDFYDYKNGFAFNDIKWQILQSKEENDLMEQIDALYEQLDKIKDATMSQFADVVKAEISAKVKPFTTASAYKHPYSHMEGYSQHSWGGYHTAVNHDVHSKKKALKHQLNYEIASGDDEEDILSDFTTIEIYNIAECTSLKMLREFLEYGTVFYTNDDLQEIYAEAKKRVMAWESRQITAANTTVKGGK